MPRSSASATCRAHADPDELVAGRSIRASFGAPNRSSGTNRPSRYALDLGDLTRDTWSLLPGADDFVAEVRTRRFDTLTYARCRNEPEDITLFNRRRGATSRSTRRWRSWRRAAASTTRTISRPTTSSTTTSTSRVPTPDRQWLEGGPRCGFGCSRRSLSQISLRLADLAGRPLGRQRAVRPAVQPARAKPEHRARQPARHAAAGRRVDADRRLQRPAGAAAAERRPSKRSAPTAARQRPVGPDDRSRHSDARSRAISTATAATGIPQPPISDYATAPIRITVPAGLGCVATGETGTDRPSMLPPQAGAAAPPAVRIRRRRGRSGIWRSSSAGSRAPIGSTVAFDDAAAEGGRRQHAVRDDGRPRWAARCTTARP